jgi:glycine/D-amino acid oxidase-like deaminating enzyme
LRAVPYWSDRFPKSRRPSHPRLRGNPTADVVVIGGGLTGCACAWSFAAAGIDVVLLESETIGGGSTAGSPGLIREEFDTSFAEASAAYGVRAARLMWRAMRRASLDFAAALKRLSIRCDLAAEDLLLVSGRDPAAVRALRREYQARRDAGFEHSWLTPAALSREAAIEAGGAIRTRGASIDPYRACVGLAAAAHSRGARLFEQSAAQKIRFTRKDVTVATGAATITARAAIVATAAPLPDLRALRRHLRPEQAYAVVTEPLPAAMRRAVGRRAAALEDRHAPPHQLRWLRDDRILFTGADQPDVAARLRGKVLVQRTGQLMYELSLLYPDLSGIQPEWQWNFGRHATADGLPFIGPHRNFPHHLFALGEGRHGAATAWLAARILLRHYQGAPAKGDDLFSFARIL